MTLTPHPLQQLADTHAITTITRLCVPADELGATWGLVDDWHCEVRRLSDASADIRRAYAWLSRRRLCRLARDKVGEVIVLSVSHAKPSKRAAS